MTRQDAKTPCTEAGAVLNRKPQFRRVLSALGPTWTVGLLAGCLLTTGCARGPRLTMSGFTPSISWGQRDEWPAETEAPESEVASVKANVAIRPESPAAGSRPVLPDLVVPEDIGFAALRPSDPPAEAGFPSDAATPAWDDVVPSSRAVASEEPEQRIQELKAALTADAGRQARERELAISEHPLRVRAESLTLRALELFRRGELVGARRAAQQAVEISETGHLDYLPTEERPSSLLNRIDAAINRQASEQQVAQNSSNQYDDVGRATLEIPLPDPETLPPQVPLLHSSDVPVRVAANRPVRLRPQEAYPELTPHLEDATAHSSATLAGALESPVGETAEVSAGSAPRIRGLPEYWREPVPDNMTSSLSQAPAPPTLDDLEPFPSVRHVQETPRELPELAQTPIRPMFSLGSLLWGFGAVCLIIGMTGIGLTIRRILTFRAG